jgi:hypothetical protein
MRSRLEAHVAAKFDVLGIEWSYEPEGYDLDGIWYLPDFWLPKIRTIVEVKGNLVAEDALEKPHRLSAMLFADCQDDWSADLPIVVVISEPWVRAEGDNDGFFVLTGSSCSDEAAQGVCHSCGASWFYDHCGTWTCRACHKGDGRGNNIMGSMCRPCALASESEHRRHSEAHEKAARAPRWVVHPSDPKAEWCPATNETRWIETP